MRIKLVILLMVFSPQIWAAPCLRIPLMKSLLNLQIETGPVESSVFESVQEDMILEFQADFARRGLGLEIASVADDNYFAAETVREFNVAKVRVSSGLVKTLGPRVDLLAAVICHELGHHLGGAPANQQNISFEGQADYFASARCLQRFFARSKVESLNFTTADYCQKAWANSEDQRLCQKVLSASRDLVSILAEMRGQIPPRLDFHDGSEVKVTMSTHPSLQCRLDTFKSGALCPNRSPIDLSFVDPNLGTCPRPKCWWSGE